MSNRSSRFEFPFFIIIIIIIIYLFKVDLIYNNFVYNKYNKK